MLNITTGTIVIIGVSLVVGLFVLSTTPVSADNPITWKAEQLFGNLPPEARELTGPLFWLRGDESPQQLEDYIAIMAEGGNGCFTAESRPHDDWLGPGWFRDLDICLQAAKKHNMKMWIFDEKWWPSQTIDGKVPARYAAKNLRAESFDVAGPTQVMREAFTPENFVAALAGKCNGEGKILRETLVDLGPMIHGGKLDWNAPAGTWKVMVFSWQTAPRLRQGGQYAVDGASQDCVDWFIQTVYQPHYDHFKEEFGKTIPGFFYDEPETSGDWGTDLNAVMAEMGVDWKTAYAAYKFDLAGDDDAAGTFQYFDAFAETWGKGMYGGMSRWCRAHNVVSMGHFMEHDYLYRHRLFCAGDMMRLQKYSDMGGIDMVFGQILPEKQPAAVVQTPKLASSIAHMYDHKDHLVMCEIFGATGQDLTYPQMKWVTDQMQIRGTNFMVPHAFNPHAPWDQDCPPFYYNGGCEARWPLYRVYADYTTRLSVMLTGGRHVCPVALVFPGNATQFGEFLKIEELTTALQNALFDVDWMPLEILAQAKIEDGRLNIHEESFRVLVIPANEYFPYEALEKARQFMEAGGVVVGYGFLPSRPLTPGKTVADMQAICQAIWGEAPQAGTSVCRTTGQGGRSYFLPAAPTTADLQQALTADAGVHPTCEVVKGDTADAVHVLHRQKDGRDIFLIANQNFDDVTRPFTFRVRTEGHPECWDAMQNTKTTPVYTRNGETVDIDLTLEPYESVLLVFQSQQRDLPRRQQRDDAPRQRLAVTPTAPPEGVFIAQAPDVSEINEFLRPGYWIWRVTGEEGLDAPPEFCWFRKSFTLPAHDPVIHTRTFVTGDNTMTLYVNGVQSTMTRGWFTPRKPDIARFLQPGENILVVSVQNYGPQPNAAGFLGKFVIELESGKTIVIHSDQSWEAAVINEYDFNPSALAQANWSPARQLVPYGQGPWKTEMNKPTYEAIDSNPFAGTFTVDTLPSGARVVVRLADIAPEAAAKVSVNGAYAGGVICGPLTLDITRHVRSGKNELLIEPFTPQSVEVLIYD